MPESPSGTKSVAERLAAYSGVELRAPAAPAVVLKKSRLVNVDNASLLIRERNTFREHTVAKAHVSSGENKRSDGRARTVPLPRRTQRLSFAGQAQCRVRSLCRSH